MDVAYDMVYVLVVDYNLRVAALYEFLHKHVCGAVVYVYGVNLSARYHAVPYLGLWEVKGILEYLDLIVYVGILGIVDARLHKIVEVYFGESLIIVLLIHAYSYDAQQHLRYQCGELAYWPKQYVEYVGWEREYAQ